MIQRLQQRGINKSIYCPVSTTSKNMVHHMHCPTPSSQASLQLLLAAAIKMYHTKQIQLPTTKVMRSILSHTLNKVKQSGSELQYQTLLVPDSIHCNNCISSTKELGPTKEISHLCPPCSEQLADLRCNAPNFHIFSTHDWSSPAQELAHSAHRLSGTRLAQSPSEGADAAVAALHSCSRSTCQPAAAAGHMIRVACPQPV